MNPTLSICLTTYNRLEALEKSIPETLKIVDAFPERVQLVVSDNGSPDGSFAFLQQVCGGRMNVTLIAQKRNVGQARSGRAAILQTKGKYVWGVGDDDRLYCDHIAELLKSLTEQNASVIFLPAAGIPECEDAQRYMLEESSGFRLKSIDVQSAAAIAVVHAAAFMATTVFLRDALLPPYIKNWRAFPERYYLLWEIALLFQSSSSRCVIGNKTMVHGNYWSYLLKPSDYYDKNDYLIDVVCISRVCAWTPVADSELGRLLRPHMKQLVEGWFDSDRLESARQFARFLSRVGRMLRAAPRLFLEVFFEAQMPRRLRLQAQYVFVIKPLKRIKEFFAVFGG